MGSAFRVMGGWWRIANEYVRVCGGLARLRREGLSNDGGNWLFGW